MTDRLILLLPSICMLACFSSIWLEARNHQSLCIKVKGLASLAFVGFAWDLGAVNSTYGQMLLIGLVFSALGDVLLAMKTQKRWFLLGIIAFLLAHVFYALAFAQTSFDTNKLPLILPVITVFLLLTLLWLRRHLSGLFKLAVPVYILAIGVMLIFAWGNQTPTAWWWIVGGASLFALSDLFVARNRFVKADIRNRIIGLPIYYLAQLVLAYSIVLV